MATNATLDPDAADFKWQDHGIVVRSVPNRDLWNAIDPNVMQDEAGVPWLTFGSFWGGIKLVKLSENPVSVANPEEWYTIARRERSFDTGAKIPGMPL